MTTLFVPREPAAEEPRVGATPETVRRLIAAGLTVIVEPGAGDGAFFRDGEYVDAGATLATDPAAALAAADLVVQYSVPTTDQVARLKEGSSIVSFLWPYDHLDVVQQLAARKVSAFAMDEIPRITRAQKSDARSSQANLAGYRAVLLAATHLPKIFPLLMTAAGTLRPARVVVIGAGVAGLQAIATARRLGAVVEVSDVRPEVKEQAASLGATYIEVPSNENLSGAGGYAKEQSEAFKKRQQEVLREHLVAADVVITTALIPYRPAPVIVPEDVVQAMRPGSVIVDLAAERGGNCACTVPGQTVVRHGVTVIGELETAAKLSSDASAMYANNVRNVLLDVIKGGVLTWKLDDEVVAGALITHGGEVLHPKVRTALGLSNPEPPPPPEPVKPPPPAPGGAGDAWGEKSDKGATPSKEGSS